jgi:xylan 1,4-beta-xylosidase
MYSSYTAASLAREYDLADKYQVNFEGALTWAFEFEDQPLFAGFRVLASGGVDLPVLNVFRMLSKMRGQRLAVESDAAISLADMLKEGVRTKPDVSALATIDRNKLFVLVWHYHDDDVAGPDADIDLRLTGLPNRGGAARVQQFRIDQDHSNAFTAWQRQGSPPQPTAAQYAELEKAGHLATFGTDQTVDVKNATALLHLKLPRQAVSLLVIE